MDSGISVNDTKDSDTSDLALDDSRPTLSIVEVEATNDVCYSDTDPTSITTSAFTQLDTPPDSTLKTFTLFSAIEDTSLEGAVGCSDKNGNMFKQPVNESKKETPYTDISVTSGIEESKETEKIQVYNQKGVNVNPSPLNRNDIPEPDSNQYKYGTKQTLKSGTDCKVDDLGVDSKKDISNKAVGKEIASVLASGLASEQTNRSDRDDRRVPDTSMPSYSVFVGDKPRPRVPSESSYSSHEETSRITTAFREMLLNKSKTQNISSSDISSPSSESHDASTQTSLLSSNTTSQNSSSLFSSQTSGLQGNSNTSFLLRTAPGFTSLNTAFQNADDKTKVSFSFPAAKNEFSNAAGMSSAFSNMPASKNTFLVKGNCPTVTTASPKETTLLQTSASESASKFENKLTSLLNSTGTTPAAGALGYVPFLRLTPMNGATVPTTTCNISHNADSSRRSLFRSTQMETDSFQSFPDPNSSTITSNTVKPSKQLFGNTQVEPKPTFQFKFGCSNNFATTSNIIAGTSNVTYSSSSSTNSDLLLTEARSSIPLFGNTQVTSNKPCQLFTDSNSSATTFSKSTSNSFSGGTSSANSTLPHREPSHPLFESTKEEPKIAFKFKFPDSNTDSNTANRNSSSTKSGFVFTNVNSSRPLFGNSQVTSGETSKFSPDSDDSATTNIGVSRPTFDICNSSNSSTNSIFSNSKHAKTLFGGFPMEPKMTVQFKFPDSNGSETSNISVNASNSDNSNSSSTNFGSLFSNASNSRAFFGSTSMQTDHCYSSSDNKTSKTETSRLFGSFPSASNQSFLLNPTSLNSVTSEDKGASGFCFPLFMNSDTGNKAQHLEQNIWKPSTPSFNLFNATSVPEVGGFIFGSQDPKIHHKKQNISAHAKSAKSGFFGRFPLASNQSFLFTPTNLDSTTSEIEGASGFCFPSFMNSDTRNKFKKDAENVWKPSTAFNFSNTASVPESGAFKFSSTANPKTHRKMESISDCAKRLETKAENTPAIPSVPFRVTTDFDTWMRTGTSQVVRVNHQYITAMPEYSKYSFDELRFYHKKYCIKHSKESRTTQDKEAQTTENIMDEKEWMTLLKEMWKILECPICFEIVTSEFYLCERGHHVCNNCWKRVVSCPLCKQHKTMQRNYVAESLVEKIPLPCRYRIDGCKKTMRQDKKSEHHDMCPYRTYVCVVENCNEAYNYNNMLTHLKTSHGDLHYKTFIQVNQKKFSMSLISHSFGSLIRAFEIPGWGLFFLRHKLSGQNSLFWIQMISNGTSDSEYFCRIEAGDVYLTRGIAYKGPVLPLCAAVDDQKDCLLLAKHLLDSMKNTAGHSGIHLDISVWKK